MDKSLEPTIIKQLKKKLEQAESRVNVLEARAKFAEEESLRKAEEVNGIQYYTVRMMEDKTKRVIHRLPN